MDADAWTKIVEDMKAAIGPLTPLIARSTVTAAGPPLAPLAPLHELTITPRPHHGSVPYTFRARCVCGWSYGFNAWKWVAVGVQEHLTDTKLMNERGRLKESSAP